MGTLTILVGKCIDCGKELRLPHDKFRSFNCGKILRCSDCCEKKGLKQIKIKTFDLKLPRR